MKVTKYVTSPPLRSGRGHVLGHWHFLRVLDFQNSQSQIKKIGPLDNCNVFQREI